METAYTMSDVAGSAWRASTRPDGSLWPTWAEWYRNERQDAHEEILSAGPAVFCKVGDVEAAFGCDDSKALTAWLRSNKAPKARKARGTSDAARLRSLAAKVRALIQEIERRDGEGNVIPDYLYSSIRAEVCHAA